MAAHVEEPYGLGDPLMLDKIDKLFACGAGDQVSLPQIIVVGDQSSGKSSVLEGLIKKGLPRDNGLCTRFATQFVFRRSVEERISISIMADSKASAEHRARVDAWARADITSLDSATFVDIMKEVHDVMGVSEVGDTSGQKDTFSKDILRLELSGPDQEHFSVIDVPGIFKNTTPGLTTKHDMELVKNMVLGYMVNPRSIMLAVIPANVDVATQEILELAADVDPEGDRTLGVLTKPDLVDNGAESRVIELLDGRARVMKLGWHVVRNLGQIQLSDSSLDREWLEDEFFRYKPYWKNVSADKAGIRSLKARLKEVLSRLVRQEFPQVKVEIMKTLKAAQTDLDNLGPERSSSAAQVAYLTELATRYQQLVMASQATKYGSDEVFDKFDSLRLASAVRARWMAFNESMEDYGHEFRFSPEEKVVFKSPTPGSTPASNASLSEEETDSEPENSFNVRLEEDLADVSGILHPQETLAVPHMEDCNLLLREIYETHRGFELGTFDPTILATAMKKQSSKWTSTSLGYVSDVIVIVHRFIDKALDVMCHDPGMRESLLNILSERLMERYEKAINQVKFLLTVERNGTPMTSNQDFYDTLENCRQNRMAAAMQEVSFLDRDSVPVVRLSDARSIRSSSDPEHVVQDIHDLLFSYYTVARKRFVDNVINQAVMHLLVTGPETPLSLFSPTFVTRLTPDQLERVAGEKLPVKRERARLKKQIESLTEAKIILTRG